MFDPKNRIQQICTEGTIKEAEGRKEEAIGIYASAWQQASDDLDKCIAAHYVATLQPTPPLRLEWYLKCLHHVVSVRHDEKRTWLTLILFNVGKSYEDTGESRDAKSYYLLAKTYERFVPETEEGQNLRTALREGIERVS